MGEVALREGGFLLGQFGLGGLPVLHHRLQPFHLGLVQFLLVPGDVHDVIVVNDLHVGLGHGDADVVPGALEVGQGGVQVQLGKLDIVRSGHAVEQVHARADGEARVRRGRAGGVGVVLGQSAAEVHALVRGTADIREVGVLGGVQLDFALGHVQFALLHVQVVFEGPVQAFLEGPGMAQVLRPGQGGGEQREGKDDSFHGAATSFRRGSGYRGPSPRGRGLP